MNWAFWRRRKPRVTERGRADRGSTSGSEESLAEDAGLRIGQAARIRVRMRRRLIGAAALLLGTAVVVPMMLDPAPRPLPDNIPIDIPSERTPFAPRLSLPSSAPASAPASAPGAEAGAPSVARSAKEGGPQAQAPEPVDEPPSSAPGASASGPASTPGATEGSPASAPGTSAGEAASAPGATAGSKAQNWYVQAAALSSESAAHQLSERLSKNGMTPFVERADTGGTVLYRVRLGPFASRDTAVKARKHLHAMGVGSNVVRVEQAER
ncbi:MAG TPA: SPOR domain-containing protein [Burkholderiaceae bacterium]|nr:SPOR domain-containing protein [Burkholderiaceae bacterium]